MSTFIALLEKKREGVGEVYRAILVEGDTELDAVRMLKNYGIKAEVKQKISGRITGTYVTGIIHQGKRGVAERPVRTLTYVCPGCASIQGVPLEDDETPTAVTCSRCLLISKLHTTATQNDQTGGETSE